MAPIIIKVTLVVALLFVIFSLGQALFVMNSAQSTSKPMSHYLGRRLLISGCVVIVVITAVSLGLLPTNNPL